MNVAKWRKVWNTKCASLIFWWTSRFRRKEIMMSYWRWKIAFVHWLSETFLFSAFVGSIGLGMVWFASSLAGYLCDRFGCRVTCFSGSTLCIVGLVSSSFVQSLTTLYFTYSALYGLGACLIFNPCILVLGKCFTDKLSTATGVVSLGGSVGVLYTGPLLQALLDSFEWRKWRECTSLFAFWVWLSIQKQQRSLTLKRKTMRK